MNEDRDTYQNSGKHEQRRRRLLGVWQKLTSALDRWRRARAKVRAATGEYRTRVRVCPRRCTYNLAQRDVVTRTRLSGRADIRIYNVFETSNCAKCGLTLLEKCERCMKPVFAPIVDRCEFCGVPHPWAVERRVAARRGKLRQWRDGEETRSPASTLAVVGEGSQLLVVDGDVTTFAVDAVISNDDTDGRMWTAVASSIKAATGPDIERDSISGGPYQLGTAWSTEAGELPIKYIIHVAAMDGRGKSSLETIRKCVWNGLDEAIRLSKDVPPEKRVRSVALAAVGAGKNVTFGTAASEDAANTAPLELWLRVIPAEIVKHLQSHPDAELTVLLALYQPDDFRGLVDLIKESINRTSVSPGRMQEGWLRRTSPWARSRRRS